MSKKECHARRVRKNRESVREYQKRWREKNQEKLRKYFRERQLNIYGINTEQYNRMVKSQLGCCAICNKSKELHVDHNHETGEVRGLLCRQCNTSLGVLENPEFVEKANLYLEETKTCHAATQPKSPKS